MKSNLLAALVAVTAPTLASAQSLDHPYRMKSPFHQMMAERSHHLPSAKPKVAAKTTAVDSRMVSSVDMEYDGSAFVPTDSFTYSYSGGHGGMIDERYLEWDWAFDLGYSYPYASGAYGAAEYKATQTFDAHDNVDTQTLMMWDGSSAWENFMRTVNTWDVSGNKTAELVQMWNSTTSAWGNDNRTSYTYSSGGKVMSYVYESWNSTSMAWENGLNTIYTRDAADRIDTEVVQYWNSTTSVWDNAQRRSFSYDASDNRTTELDEGWTGTAWMTVEKYQASGFVGMHQPQTIVYLSWNATTSSFDSTSRYHYTYNANNKPEYYYEEDWGGTPGSWAPSTSSTATRMHYENYGTAGIKAVNDPGAVLQLFPVPATATVTVKAVWNEAQPFSVAIADMSGRIFATWTVATTSNYSEVVPVDRLPAGQYILTLYGKTGAVSQRFSVVK